MTQKSNPRRKSEIGSWFPVQVTLLLFLLSRVWGAEITATNTPLKVIGDFTIGFSSLAFMGVNRSDAEAAFKVFLMTAAKQRNYDLQTKLHVFETAGAFEEAIRRGALQLAIVPSWDFLAMNLKAVADPYFVTQQDGCVQEEYLLLTARGAGIEKLTDLRGKNVILLECVNAYLSRHWIDTILRQQGLGPPEKFFGHLESVHKPAGAILPVFFGKCQACVTPRSAYNILKEMNPQIGQHLQITLTSEPLLNAVICLGKTGWLSAHHKHDLIDALTELHNIPAGQQILTLFKTQKMAPFREDYLRNIQRLKATCASDQPSGSTPAEVGKVDP